MRNRRGFTLIEIMIVVLIVAILLFVALPNALRSERQGKVLHDRATCLSNLRVIQQTQSEWAYYNKLPATTKPTWDGPKGITRYLEDKGAKKPKCPSGGTYNLGETITAPPTCTHKGHRL